MALVTVQRSANSVSDPQSKSDGEAEDDESSKNEKSECFFAGKGTALVLALKDIPQHVKRRLSTDSTRSTNSTQSNNSDIQQFLQSMFNLLRQDETLKMAVKLESQRQNRTRYLVIASRCRSTASPIETKNKNSQPSPLPPPPPPSSAKANLPNNETACTPNELSSTTTTTTTTVVEAIGGCIAPASNRLQQSLSHEPNMNRDCATTDSVHEKHSSSSSYISSNRQSLKCDADRNTASGDGNCVEDGIEESCLLGIDCNDRTTIGLVVPILADTSIRLDGDGGFSVSVFGKTHIFKPVSVQAMWSVLQTLHKVSQKARENNFYPGGPSHDWLGYYASRVESDQSCLNEWNAMDSLESRRPPSPDAIRNKPTAKDETENVIKMKLKEIMMSVDLDEVTSKYIRSRLEEHLDMDLGEYKSFIDAEMLMILGQMDAPTKIFDHVYLGSEWNASNLEELQKNGVRHILNVTREIDNFFPGMFDYFNVRVYDDEKTNLLKHWDNTYRYITQAKSEGSKVLVHCKMGVSRSASVVIAYAMKAYNWEFQQALLHVKDRRNCIKPNKNFLNQLETYRGMLDAMKNKEKLQRSKSETNLKSVKDARLLPGSEPTPLIQALNQSRSSEHEANASHETASHRVRCVTTSSTEVKQRRGMRRSSSSSPKSSHIHGINVTKQQSQSLENLTPERSISEEPRNVRFPGNNGENYSVTQNQVMHIQKNTPPPPPPPPPPLHHQHAALPPPHNAQSRPTAAATPPTSVRTIVHDLEAHQDDALGRPTDERRNSINQAFGRSMSHDTDGTIGIAADVGQLPNATHGGSVSSLSSMSNMSTDNPVWTSSAKLITRSSNDSGTLATLRGMRSRHNSTTGGGGGGGGGGGNSCDTIEVFSSQYDNVFVKDDEQRRHHTRHKSHPSAFGGIVGGGGGGALNFLTKTESKSSIESILSANSENRPQTRPKQRELPFRHASWGSGDHRYTPPMRNSSWNAYDANCNSTIATSAFITPAIIEGQTQELNMSKKTAITTNTNTITHHHHTANSGTAMGDDMLTHRNTTEHHHSHLGTVKRTKQKLEESTILKKRCQGNESDNHHHHHQSTKQTPNLYRSASTAGCIQVTCFPHRCNSEEIPSATAGLLQRAITRRSDGSRPHNTDDLFPQQAPTATTTTTYTMSDIANKNTLPSATATGETADSGDDAAAAAVVGVVMRSMSASVAEDPHKSSGHVQILKKNFEAKAGGAGGGGNGAGGGGGGGTLQASNLLRKGHQSLPSSPVAQHVDHSHQCNAADVGLISDGATTTTTTDYFGTAKSLLPTTTAMTTMTTSSSTTIATTNTTTTTTTSTDHTSSSSSPSSSASEGSSSYSDRNVKGLVHKYQTTTSASTTVTTAPTSTAKSRPRSYYDHTHTTKSTALGKMTAIDYNCSRPPPAPAKIASSANVATATTTVSELPANTTTTTTAAAVGAAPATTMTEGTTVQQQQHEHQVEPQQHLHQQQQQQQQPPPPQRRLQQHGRTHPLARLSLPKQSFNTAAYNTM